MPQTEAVKYVNTPHDKGYKKSEEWKQKSKLSGRINQHLVQIPFARLIEMIQYNAEECGIAVIPAEESDTSGTGFIDNEESVKENYSKSRRMHRGLFRSNDGSQRSVWPDKAIGCAGKRGIS